MGYPKGRPQSPESIAKRRAAMLARYQNDPAYRERTAERLRALAADPDVNARRRAAMQAQTGTEAFARFQEAAQSAETKAKRVIGIRAANKDPAVNEKRRVAMKARIADGTWNSDFGATRNSPEATAKRLATNLANGNTARSLAAMRASMARPDVREKLSAERRARAATPQGRAKMLLAAAAAHTPEVNERRRAASRAYAQSADGQQAKVRGGLAAMKTLRGASGHKAWEYGGNRFRSSWERDFARFLDRLGTKWAYEPKVYRLDDGRSYVPDFAVEIPGAGTVIVEIKGIRSGPLAPQMVAKFQAFRDKYGVPSLMLSADEIAAVRASLE